MNNLIDISNVKFSQFFRFHLPAIFIFVLSISFVQIGCVSKTFSNVGELEEFPFRDPDPKERAMLERCIRHLYKAQQDFKAKHGRFALKSGPIAKDAPCDDVRLRLQSNGEQFVMTLVYNESETTIKWEVDERGIVTEYGETDTEGLDSF